MNHISNKFKIMKYYISFFAILLCCTSVGQTNFDRGFNAGYKAGYCYNKGACIEPIPPIAPIPNYYENSNIYSDGYNRGFTLGNKQQQPYAITTERNRYETSQPEFIDFSSSYTKHANTTNSKEYTMSEYVDTCANLFGFAQANLDDEHNVTNQEQYDKIHQRYTTLYLQLKNNFLNNLEYYETHQKETKELTKFLLTTFGEEFMAAKAPFITKK